MSRFLNRALNGLKPYVPGEQPQDMQYIKLNTNENPYPPSPAVMDAVNRGEVEKLRLYSDPEVKALTGSIADFYGVSAGQVAVNNGSDETLAFAFMAFGGDGMKFPSISYGFYPVYAELFGIKAAEIPLDEDFAVRAEDYAGNDSAIVIANPNAPTGMAMPLSDIERILRANPDYPVIIDEAYADFGAESAVKLLPDYDNLLVIQTFSKSRSLAGGRLGFAIGSEELIGDLQRIKFSFNPYSINRLSALAGEAAMRDRKYFEKCVSCVIRTREYTAEGLRRLGFRVLQSKANFIFAESPDIAGKELYLGLKERGILVRHFDKERIENFVRVSIGTPEDMQTFLNAAAELVVK